jgi:hypothetical protein
MTDIDTLRRLRQTLRAYLSPELVERVLAEVDAPQPEPRVTADMERIVNEQFRRKAG